MSNKEYSTFKISTSSRSQFIDITDEVSDIVAKNKVENGSANQPRKIRNIALM